MFLIAVYCTISSTKKQTQFQLYSHLCYTEELFHISLSCYISSCYESHKHTVIEREEERDMLQQATTCWGICLSLPVLYEINAPLKHWHSITERANLISRIGEIPFKDWQMSFSVWLLPASNNVSHCEPQDLCTLTTNKHTQIPRVFLCKVHVLICLKQSGNQSLMLLPDNNNHRCLATDTLWLQIKDTLHI